MRSPDLRRRKWILLVVVMAAAASTVWLCSKHGQPAAEDPSLLFGRLWVDRVPQRDLEFVHGLVALKKLPMGAFQHASAYRLLAERFDYRHQKGELNLHFPQDGRVVKLSYTVVRCNDLPPYDLCLMLSDSPWEGGPKRYYSKRDGSKNSEAHRRLAHRLRALAAELR